MRLGSVRGALGVLWYSILAYARFFIPMTGLRDSPSMHGRKKTVARDGFSDERNEVFRRFRFDP